MNLVEPLLLLNVSRRGILSTVMKLQFPRLTPHQEPIDSVEKYLLARQIYDGINEDILNLQLAIKQVRQQGKVPDPSQFEKLDELTVRKREVRSDFFTRQPNVLISICPYCHTFIWMGVGIFSLRDEFWYRIYSNGREEVTTSSQCEHLFCVDGALNLNNHNPTEVYAPITASRNYIYMGAEVPFIKPRLLSLPTMIAVIHSFPVADIYTAYPVVYYTEQHPSQEKFSLGWGRTEYVDSYQSDKSVTFSGKRSDVQEYHLQKWIIQKKVLWVEPESETTLCGGDNISFPYDNLLGYRNPYAIENGRRKSLKSPKTNSKPIIHLER